MAITISGENNNDRILASDGVIDQISGINIVGLITASHINVGSNINLGNAGIITATTFVGNLTGNVNSTSPLLLQTGGSERFRITGNNELGIAGANYGTSGQVLTSGGSGNAVTWSAIPSQVTIANNADNRIITGGSGVNLNGEANLTFDASTTQLKITRDDDSNSGLYVFHNDGNECARLVQKGTGHEGALVLKDGGTATVLLDGETGSDSYINSGNVGIGTDNPTTYKLHLQGSTSALARFERTGGAFAKVDIKAGSSSGNSYITFSDPDASEVGEINYEHADNSLKFNTNSAERFRIDSSGRLIQRYSAAPYGNRAATFQSPAGETSTYIAVVNTETNGASGIVFGDHAGQNAGNYDGYINYNHQYQHMQFMVGSGTERLRIKSDGRIEIGTGSGVFSSAPMEFKVSSSSGWGGFPEHISLVDQKAYNASDNGGGIVFSGKFNSGGNATTFGGIHCKKANTTDGEYGGSLHFLTRTHGGANDERLRIRSDGGVQFYGAGGEVVDFGTTGGSGGYHKYDLSANGATTGYIGAGNQLVSGAAVADFGFRSQANMVFSTGGDTERLRITSAGQVAIRSTGSTSTSVNLLVYGDSDNSDIATFSGGDWSRGLKISTSANGGINDQNVLYDAQGTGGQHFFKTGGTIVGRLEHDQSGFISENVASGDGDDECGVALQNDYSSWAIIYKNDWIGNSGGWGTFWAGNSGAHYRRVSSDNNPNEHVMVGSGQKRFTFDLDSGGHAYFDGNLEQNNYDYAEYFEWEDGNPSNEDRRGYSVFVNSNGKIEKATDSTNTADIIGVISGTAAVIGDAAIYDWQGKWKHDEWGTLVTEVVKQVSWKDDEGKRHSYDQDKVPSGITIPSHASYRQHKRRILNPDYDESKEYVPRDMRQEWDTVGLLGKVRVRDDSPKNPNWKFIKTINGKKLWLIR